MDGSKRWVLVSFSPARNGVVATDLSIKSGTLEADE